jgi:hypothetical protein
VGVRITRRGKSTRNSRGCPLTIIYGLTILFALIVCHKQLSTEPCGALTKPRPRV